MLCLVALPPEGSMYRSVQIISKLDCVSYLLASPRHRPRCFTLHQALRVI